MNRLFIFILVFLGINATAQFSPAVGQPGSTAIHKDSSAIVGWANDVVSFTPGPQDISEVGSPVANFGVPGDAANYAEGNSVDVVSLGDGGEIVLSFHYPIMNGAGPDFAVFENSFDDTFLELAHVEVSTDGETFVRFPSTSLVPITVQTGSFGDTDTKLIDNLAGKFRQGYGTPFDLEDLTDSIGINLDSINYVKVIDVVGSVSPVYGSFDQFGTIINDPFPTAFESGGFDLDGIGVLNANGDFQLGLKEAPQLVIYPNPVRDVLKVKNADVESIGIFSLDGRLISETMDSQLDLGKLVIPDGIYLVSISTPVGRVVQKIQFLSY